MSEFHFLRPAWFLALLPVLMLLVLLWRRGGQAANWQGVISPVLLPHLLLENGNGLRRFPLLALGLGWLLAVTALAGPTWERQLQPVYHAPIDRVLVLDMSPSMAATDIKPDRITRARYAIGSLLSDMREGRVALVVFGAESHVVAPLTDDAATIEALLPALSPDILPAPGNRGGPALRVAADLLQRVGSPQGEILLLSDGISDTADTLEAVHELRRQGVRTSVLGVGTLAGAPVPTPQGGFEMTGNGSLRLARLDESGLSALARAGGGRYQRPGEGPVAALFYQPIERDPAQARIDKEGIERWVEKGPWLLLPLLLLAAGAFRRGWLAVLAVLVIPPPQAHALSWQDLWLRPDQQAARLLQEGDAGAAAKRFEHPGWRATANYEAGDYAAAAEGFSGGDADNRYNRGNALARAGRLQEALAAYDEALARQPGHEDARFNRELIEKLLQSQQQSSGQESASDGSKNESQYSTGQQGSMSDPHEQQDTSQAGPPETEIALDPDAKGMPDNEKADSDPQQPTSDTVAEESAREQNAGQDDTGEQIPVEQDNTTQARADVAPTVNEAAQENNGMQAEQVVPEVDPQRMHKNNGPQEPMSEQQLALEQWLRQVPDDPAGLLRRKFMLEHLMRQNRVPTP